MGLVQKINNFKLLYCIKYKTTYIVYMDTYDIFTYCGGKCGGSTLHNAFINNGFTSLHVHSNAHYQANIIKSMDHAIFDAIDSQSKDIYFFDSYRTQIERKISAFFQNLYEHLPNYKELSVEEIIHFFNQKMLYKLEEYHSINEVLQHYDVPLFDTFDFDKRYNIVKKDNKIFVKILFRDIGNWSSILSEILGKDIVIHDNDNISENKEEYYSLYKEFREKYRIPLPYLENLMNDGEFTIYNTYEQQREYINHWLGISSNQK